MRKTTKIAKKRGKREIPESAKIQKCGKRKNCEKHKNVENAKIRKTKKFRKTEQSRERKNWQKLWKTAKKSSLAMFVK